MRAVPVIAVVMLAATAQAQDFNQLFQWSATVGERGAESVTLDARLTVADGHMVYREDLAFELDGEGLAIGDVQYAQPVRKFDEFSGEDKDLYVAGTYRFSIPVALGETAPETITLIAAYRGCSDSVCFFPQRKSLNVSLAGDAPANAEPPAGGAAAVQEAQGTTPIGESTQGDFAQLMGEGRYLSLFLLLFAAGMVTSLLPCVYPIIPITVNVIGAAGAKNIGQSFVLSLVFVLGMAIVFAVLGVVAGMAGQLSGALLASPAVKAVLVAIFFAMALSMFGLFELNLPPSISNRLSTVGGQGFAGSFSMGAVSGILATPCTGPVLVGILAYIAQTQSPLVGFIALFIYALGLGVLFLAVGTFSGLLSAMPRSGNWMDYVKSAFGVVFIAIGLYYAKGLVPWLHDIARPQTGPILAGIVLAIVGALLGAVHLKFRKGAMATNLRKSAGAVVMGFGVFLAAASPLGEPALPDDWLSDHDQALEVARAGNKPVMIDFFTEDCTNCKKLVRDTFTQPQVAERLEEFVVAKVDLTDHTAPGPARLIEKYGIRGVPLVVFYDAEGNELTDKRIGQFVPPDTFLEHLRDIR